MTQRGQDDVSRPLLSTENSEFGVVDENIYGEESAPRDVQEPSPAWLSEQQGPLQDSPATFSPLNMGFTNNQQLTGLSHRLPTGKLSRSMKRGPTGAARARRQPWIVLDEHGHRSFLHADKRAIIHNIGLHIPIRDMRLLDFNLGASDSTILVRDNAIILSIEHVRFIVTADRAIIPREGAEQNPLTARFVDVLEDALHEWTRQRAEFQAQQEYEANRMNQMLAASGSGVGGTQNNANDISSFGTNTNIVNASSTAAATHSKANSATNMASDVDDTASINHELEEPLPFELIVLEAALKEVVTSQTLQIKELEGVALPALDALTKSVSPANLERVRKVKTRHQRLTIRTEALREELQRFLQDDDDMSEMCLTRRKEIEEAAKMPTDSSAGAPGRHSTHHHHQGSQPQPHEWTTPPPSAFASGASFTRRGSMALARLHSGGSPPNLIRTSLSSAIPSRDVLLSMSGNGPTAAAVAAAAEEDADAEAQQEVENLLESYYMQVDGLYDKLVSVGEYIKDTEEYINIELDSSRNRLIRFEVVLTVATFSIMPFNLIAGILGENLIIPEQITASVHQFYGVNVAATVFCCIIFYITTLYMRHAKLI